MCARSEKGRDDEATTHQRRDAGGRAGCTIMWADRTGAVWGERRRGTDSEGVCDRDDRKRGCARTGVYVCVVVCQPATECVSACLCARGQAKKKDAPVTGARACTAAVCCLRAPPSTRPVRVCRPASEPRTSTADRCACGAVPARPTAIAVRRGLDVGQAGACAWSYGAAASSSIVLCTAAPRGAGGVARRVYVSRRETGGGGSVGSCARRTWGSSKCRRGRRGAREPIVPSAIVRCVRGVPSIELKTRGHRPVSRQRRDMGRGCRTWIQADGRGTGLRRAGTGTGT